MAVTSATAAGKAAQASGRGQVPRADPVDAQPNFGTGRGAPLPTKARRKDDGTAMEDISSPSAFLAEEVDFSDMALARTSDTAAGSEVAAAGVRRGAARKRKSTSKAIAAESKSTAYTPPASSTTLAAAQVPAPSSNHLNLGQENLFRHPPTSTLLSSMLSSAEGEDIAEDEDMADASPSAVATYRSSAMMEEMSLSSAHLRSDDFSSLSPQKFSSASGSFTSGLVLDPATRASLRPTEQDRIRRMAEVLSIGAGFLPQENQSFFGGVLGPPGGSDGGEDDPEALMANVPSAEAVQARKDGRKLQIPYPGMKENSDQYLAEFMEGMMAKSQNPELRAKAAALEGFSFSKAVNAGGKLSSEDQQWEAGFEKVESYVRTAGHVNSLSDENAYRWLKRQEEQVAKGELSEEKTARLQKLLGVPIGVDPKTAELPPPTDGRIYSPMEAFTILRKYSHLNNRQLSQLKERMLTLTPLQTTHQVGVFVTKYAGTEDPESLTWEDIFPYAASVRTALAATAAFTSPVPAHEKEKGVWALYMNHAHGKKKFEKGHVFTKEELDGAATESLVLSFFQAKKELSFATGISQMANLSNLLQHTDVGRALRHKSTPGNAFHDYLKTCKGVPATFGKGRGAHNYTKPRKTKASRGRHNEALRGVGKQPAKKRSNDGGGKQPAKKRSNDGGGKQQPKQRKKAGGGKQPARKQGKAAGGGRKKRAESDAEEFFAEAPAAYTDMATNFAAI